MWRASFDEHAISVGIEAVASADGVIVGMQNIFFPGEGAYEHKQSRLRQVKIGEHGMDGSEFESGIDE